MTFIYILLLLIVVILFLVYMKFDKSLAEQTNLRTRIYPESESENGYFKSNEEIPASIFKWLLSIVRQMQDVTSRLSAIADHYSADNPAGMASDRYKKMSNLVRIYAEHLTATSGMSLELALIQARFEYFQYGEEQLINAVDGDWLGGGVYGKERNKAKVDYFDSGLLEAAIAKASKPIPWKLAASMYDILVIRRSVLDIRDQPVIELETYPDKIYSDFLNKWSIAVRLEELGIIEKPAGFSTRQPRWLIPNKNWQEIKSTIYGGGASHDDSIFEEAYNEGGSLYGKRVFDIPVVI